MAEGRGPLRAILPIVLVGLSLLGMYNVFADNAEVRQLAESLAKSPKDTQPRLTRESKNPIGQSFDFQVADRGIVNVDCRRSYYFLGAWTCKVVGGAAASGPAASSSAR